MVGILDFGDLWGFLKWRNWRGSTLDEVHLHRKVLGDEYTWIFEKSGIYSTRSMYRSRMFRVVNRRMDKLWRNQAPMKTRVFMRLVFQYKVQTGVNLKKKKNGKELLIVAFVGFLKTKTVWTCFKQALGCDRIPNFLQDICDHWLPLNNCCYQINFLSSR